MHMERNKKCEDHILNTLMYARLGCRIEAFDEGVFDKQTINSSLTYLLHDKKVHNKGLNYHIGAPPPVFKPKPKKSANPNKRGKSERKMRAERYVGDLTDKSSAERPF